MNRPPSCCTVCHNTRGTGTQSLTCALGSASFNTTLHHKMINRKNLLGKRAKRKVVHSKSRKCKRCYLVFEIRGWRCSHGSRYRVLFWCLRFRSLLCVPREMSTPQPAPSNHQPTPTTCILFLSFVELSIQLHRYRQ